MTIKTSWSSFFRIKELNAVSVSGLYGADHALPFAYGVLRTYEAASATSVAEILENQCLPTDDGNGIVFAYLPAPVATCALVQVHHWNTDCHRLASI